MDQTVNIPVTVFMAAFNSAAYLREAISSILVQSFTDFELLIVNDGSTDDTAKVIAEYNDPRIRTIHNAANMGLFFTRNLALTEARGAFIAVMDSDDVAMPDRLQLQYDFMMAHPLVGVCGGHALPIDNAGTITGKIMAVPTGFRHMDIELVFRNIFINSTVMMRRDVFLEMKGYQNYALAEDYDLFIRVSANYQLANIDHLLVKYRVHGTNITLVSANNLEANQLKIVAGIQSRLGIPRDERLIRAHQSFLVAEGHKLVALGDYRRLLDALKLGNQQTGIYPEHVFNQFLLNKWVEILKEKKAGLNAFQLFMNAKVADWNTVSAKHLRRIFKLSLKNFYKISRYSD